MKSKLEQIKKSAIKKARGKFLTSSLANGLFRVAKDNGSTLTKAYINSFYCNNRIDVDDFGRAITNNCKNRFCRNCLNKRTSILIDKYSHEISRWSMYFVTLTIPNVKKNELADAIRKRLLADFTKIKIAAKKEKIKIKCIRSIECTYNWMDNTFHPHLHIMVHTLAAANFIKNRFLAINPDCSPAAQDVREVVDTEEGMQELFKYTTKLFDFDKATGKRRKTPMWALDVIFQAIKGIRVVQPVGFKKEKDDLDEISEIQDHRIKNERIDEYLEDLKKYASENESYKDFIKSHVVTNSYVWSYEFIDWVDIETGEPMTDYAPNQAFKKLIEEENLIGENYKVTKQLMADAIKLIGMKDKKKYDDASFVTSLGGFGKISKIGSYLYAKIIQKGTISLIQVEKLFDRLGIGTSLSVNGGVYYLPKLLCDRANGTDIVTNRKAGTFFEEIFKEIE